jgi:dipeptidyl aminopeptidase/acylaminoacyl peptidase
LVRDLRAQLRVDQDGMPTRVDDGGRLVVASNAAGHSWSPNQTLGAYTEFTFGIQIDYADGFPELTRIHEIWTVDLAAEPGSELTLVASGDGIGGPEWSSDGKRIGYVSWSGTVVYDVATGRTKILADTNRYGWGNPVWSPTGDHLVLYRWNKRTTSYDGMFRLTADLSAKTEIPGTLGGGYEIPIGWRD